MSDLFGQQETFEIETPEFDSRDIIKKFSAGSEKGKIKRVKIEKSFYYYYFYQRHGVVTETPCIISQRYSLMPGRKYKVEVFPLMQEEVLRKECLDFIKKRDGILAGIQGLVLCQELLRNQLADKLLISLNESNCDEKTMVPVMIKSKFFDLYHENFWKPDHDLHGLFAPGHYGWSNEFSLLVISRL